MNDVQRRSPISRRLTHLSLATAFPVVVALVVSALELLASEGRPRLPCPLYHNAVVAFAAELHEACPLEPGDSILGIEVAGRTESIDSDRELARYLSDGAPARLVIRRAGETTDRRVSVVPVTTPPSNAALQLASSMLVAASLLAFVLLTAVR